MFSAFTNLAAKVHIFFVFSKEKRVEFSASRATGVVFSDESRVGVS
jgi:hypothetical protein